MHRRVVDLKAELDKRLIGARQLDCKQIPAVNRLNRSNVVSVKQIGVIAVILFRGGSVVGAVGIDNQKLALFVIAVVFSAVQPKTKV